MIRMIKPTIPNPNMAVSRERIGNRWTRNDRATASPTDCPEEAADTLRTDPTVAISRAGMARISYGRAEPVRSRLLRDETGHHEVETAPQHSL